MIKCDNCVDEICDFCGYYSFNGDKHGVYLDKGFCNKYNVRKQPEHGKGCEEFVCVGTEEGKKLNKIYGDKH